MDKSVENLLEYFAAPKLDLDDDGGEDWDPEDVGIIETALTAARAEGKAEGIREEREACAVLVSDWRKILEGMTYHRLLGDVERILNTAAAAIRARGGK